MDSTVPTQPWRLKNDSDEIEVVDTATVFKCSLYIKAFRTAEVHGLWCFTKQFIIELSLLKKSWHIATIFKSLSCKLTLYTHMKLTAIMLNILDSNERREMPLINNSIVSPKMSTLARRCAIGELCICYGYFNAWYSDKLACIISPLAA